MVAILAAKTALNLAIFGGSFDPPHAGHLAVIRALLGLEFLDLILIVPAFLNPLKNPPQHSPDSRLSMLENLISGLEDSARARLKISRFEIAQNRPSYTIETILHFKKIYRPKALYLAIGADVLAGLSAWRDFSRLAREVRFIIATRGGVDIAGNLARLNLAAAAILAVNEAASSSALRGRLATIRALKSEAKSEADLEKTAENAAQNAAAGQMAGNLGAQNLETQNAEAVGGLKMAQNADAAQDLQGRVDFIAGLLDAKKAEDIAVFDLCGCNYITSFVVLATSLADKHSFALLDALKTELKPRGEQFFATDEESGDWIIADIGDVMIHIFTQNHRKKFNLEEFLGNYKREAGFRT